MRVLIVTQEDPFYIPLFFREFFRDSRDDIHVVGVAIQKPLGNRTARGLAKRIRSLYGTLGFVVMGLRYLWRKILGLAGRWAPTVRGLCRRYDVPLVEETDANSDAFLNLLVEKSVDLIVSVSASQIFRAPVLAATPLGCINLHNAPLPRYRGMLPNFWQLYYGETESVLTIHRMVAELDAGAILLQRSTPITDSMSLEQLIRLTKIRSAHALWDLLEQLRDGTATESPMPQTGGSYHTWPTREEARELRRRGRRLL